MNNLKSAVIRNVLASCLAVAVLAVMGVGQVQAQGAGDFVSDNATVNATIEVVQELTITSGGTLNFGTVFPGQTGVNAGPVELTVNGHSGASFDLSLNTVSPTFDPASGPDFSWTPTVTVNETELGGTSGEFTLTTSGAANINVSGTVDVPQDVEGEQLTSSDLQLTVTYTSL